MCPYVYEACGWRSAPLRRDLQTRAIEESEPLCGFTFLWLVRRHQVSEVIFDHLHRKQPLETTWWCGCSDNNRCTPSSIQASRLLSSREDAKGSIAERKHSSTHVRFAGYSLSGAIDIWTSYLSEYFCPARSDHLLFSHRSLYNKFRKSSSQDIWIHRG